jgi:hypothetical protein
MLQGGDAEWLIHSLSISEAGQSALHFSGASVHISTAESTASAQLCAAPPAGDRGFSPKPMLSTMASEQQVSRCGPIAELESLDGAARVHQDCEVKQVPASMQPAIGDTHVMVWCPVFSCCWCLSWFSVPSIDWLLSSSHHSWDCTKAKRMFLHVICLVSMCNCILMSHQRSTLNTFASLRTSCPVPLPKRR